MAALSKEEFLAQCDYQMKKIELAKEAVFFQQYEKAYDQSYVTKNTPEENNEKERE